MVGAAAAAAEEDEEVNDEEFLIEASAVSATKERPKKAPPRPAYHGVSTRRGRRNSDLSGFDDGVVADHEGPGRMTSRGFLHS